MVTRGFTGRQSGSEPSDWIPRDSTSSTISRCLRSKPRSKRQIIHSASGSYGRTGARRRVSKERTQMLSRTIHVDDLKCCREGGVPGRSTWTSRSTASRHSRSGKRSCSQ